MEGGMASGDEARQRDAQVEEPTAGRILQRRCPARPPRNCRDLAPPQGVSLLGLLSECTWEPSETHAMSVAMGLMMIAQHIADAAILAEESWLPRRVAGSLAECLGPRRLMA